MAGLDTLTKRDLELDFGDKFGFGDATEMSVELHALTEAKLKL